MAEPTILDAIDDGNLFGAWFRGAGSWDRWLVFLAALFGLPMTDEQAETFRYHTGRAAPPATQSREAWLVVGRRGGKSFVMAAVAVFLACFRQYRRYLQPGEMATIFIIAADRDQARTITNYIGGMLEHIPILRGHLMSQRDGVFELTGSVLIEVGTASYRSVRGRTFAAIICDEVAFWRTDESSANPDSEILAALRPGLTTIPGSMLICASSPYARRGALWDAYSRFWGRDEAPLVWRGTSLEMNPSLDPAIVAAEMERDPARARAEYEAVFRVDAEMLLSREAVTACVSPGRRELPPSRAFRYYAFTDPSGGSADSMTLAIAHNVGGQAVLDAVREVRPPFSPQVVVSEFAALLRSYGLSEVTGDRYAGEWVRDTFRAFGIRYRVSELTKSELYLSLVPAVNSGVVDLLDLPRLTDQLIALERRVTRGGRDIVDHAPHSHDDVANAVAGALTGAGAANRFVPRVGTFGMGGKVVWRDGQPKPRAWSRTPGISAVDGTRGVPQPTIHLYADDPTKH
jgi:hypothetical protein